MASVSSATTAFRPLIGAIRWDAWYDGSGGVVAQAVQTDLSPAAFQSRAPAFATPTPAGGLTIDGDTTAEMTREIQLAQTAGIDYWAFNYYAPGDPMRNALQLYLQNPDRAAVDFALIDFAGWGATQTSYTAMMDQRAGLMAQPTYQRVAGGRPLYYVMLPSASIVSQWWGGDARNMGAALDYLRRQVTAATGENPYVVVMGAPLAAAAFAQAVGADGISAYAVQGGDIGGTYQTLSSEVSAERGAALATGEAVIPTVMTGWDPSPRQQNPVPWGSSGTASYATATPAQIASQLGNALAWLAAHPDSTAGTALVYAWNEFDEGGWLAPTYVPGNPAGDTSRLDAVAAETALFHGATVTRAGDGSYRIALTDGSAMVYRADNAVVKYTPSGRVYETDNADGTVVMLAADGTATWYSAAGAVTRIVDPSGAYRLKYTDGWLIYDSKGQYTTHEVDLANGSRQLHNSAGRLYEIDSANGTRQLFGADGTQTFMSASGVVQKIIAADGSFKTAYADGWLYYSKAGKYLQHETDLPGGLRQFHDAMARLTEIDYANGSRTLFAADGTQTRLNAAGTVTSITAADGSYRNAWTDGWLYYSKTGAYLQHESDAADGTRSFYNAHGTLTSVSIGSGTAPGLLLPALSVTDTGSGVVVGFGPTSASVALHNLAHDPGFVLDLTGGVGGYSSVWAVLAALRSDGAGGSMLDISAAQGIAIDFVAMPKASLTAGHFRIG